MPRRQDNRHYTRPVRSKDKKWYGSPYWTSLMSSLKLNINMQNNHIIEPLKSNPDMEESESLNQLYKDQQEIDRRKTVLKELLKVAIKRTKLTAKQRKYIQEVFYVGKSITEVAETEQLSVKTVFTQIKRAIEKIKKIADKM